MEERKEFKSFFKTVGGNEGGKCHYPTRLDTYGCGCSHDCSYCLDGETKILMYDGSTKFLKDVEVGDEIYGVIFDGKYHRYTKSIVENKWGVVKPSYKITLKNGTELICSADHQWLTNRGWKYTIGSMTGKMRRPYLTNKQNLMGLNTLDFIKRYACLENVALKNSKYKDLGIVAIEKYNEQQELYDITTSTHNFIANGVVSHNCYAKSLLDFRKMWDPTNPSIADIDKIRRKISKLPKDTPALRLGGMTDCFQPIETNHRVTYETIKALNEANIPYLIVTKSALVADDAYTEIMRKDLAHIQVTITTTDDELSKTYEKASVPSERIKAVEKLQELGFDVSVRLSPYIPELVDIDKINTIKCDKILVEFLRVNSWIEKWFNVDYSHHTIKHGGYKHMPLEYKKELISKITGFKEVTVCEDEDEAYEYWKNNFNPNPDDCCNLRK